MSAIIALWSHPRSMSTAIERIMRERGDLICFHEPFMYDYYVHRKVRQMPHFNAEADRPASYKEVRDMLLEQSESSPVFIKDMSYYVVPQLLDDSEFNDRLINWFLIRHPVATIASYFKLDPEVTCEEIGLQAQYQHYEALCATQKLPPMVIQAEDIRTDTIKSMQTLWALTGLSNAEHAFNWRRETPQDWHQVHEWHGDVIASTGIRPLSENERTEQIQRFETMANKHPRMQEYLDHHLPYYEKLKTQAIELLVD